MNKRDLPDELQLLKIDEVLELTTRKRSTLYVDIKKGDFPPPLKLSGERAARWRKSDVIKWIRELTSENRNEST